MSLLYNENAPKKTTSLTINTDLLVQAKQLDINISSILESALIQTLKQKKRDNWIKDNSEAIDCYNKSIEKSGLFSDGMRLF